MAAPFAPITPLLTSRGQRNPEPLRVVLSRTLDLPNTAQLWDQSSAATLVAHGPEASTEAKQQLDQLGVERLELKACEPAALLEALAQRGCNRVLWECGPQLAAAAIAAGCVQRNRGRGGTSALGQHRGPHAPGRSGLHVHGSGDSPCAQ